MKNQRVQNGIVTLPNGTYGVIPEVLDWFKENYPAFVDGNTVRGNVPEQLKNYFEAVFSSPPFNLQMFRSYWGLQLRHEHAFVKEPFQFKCKGDIGYEA